MLVFQHSSIAEHTALQSSTYGMLLFHCIDLDYELEHYG